MIAVDYTPLPVIADTATAANDESGTLWEDCPENEAFLFQAGDAAATEAGFAKADHVVKQRIVINRVATVSMEPRGCNASYDRMADSYTVYAGAAAPRIAQGSGGELFPSTGAQVPRPFQRCRRQLRHEGRHLCRIPAALWASTKIGRPVKWASDRSESFASDEHARDNITEAELALSKDGDFLALRVKTTVNIGAYLATMGPQPAIGNIGTLAGVYTTPAIHVAVTGAFSNTNPTSPYRGAGRPEAAM